MKQIKFISVLLLTLIFLCFSACNNDNEENDQEPTIENTKYDFNKTDAENYLKKLFYWDNAKTFNIKHITYSYKEVLYAPTGNIIEVYDFSTIAHFETTINGEPYIYDIIYNGEIVFSVKSNSYSVQKTNSKTNYYN
ncbi:hypothetical protein [Dysgonomonas sp. ZJ279]|uniref:hypothetical protein n=1 Tax=Dysgonomonas sp. ZJ279 TaxID=2709796 RepID=UPI0013EC1A78|nr:hypothetical protein [Dysgonomonas sp. ZJ279]